MYKPSLALMLNLAVMRTEQVMFGKNRSPFHQQLKTLGEGPKPKKKLNPRMLPVGHGYTYKTPGRMPLSGAEQSLLESLGGRVKRAYVRELKLKYGRA